MVFWNQARVLVSLLLTTALALGQEECTPCYSGEEPFKLEPLRPGEEGYNCTDAIERATKMVNQTEECFALQLGTYQGGCCDRPPPDFCTLCPNGSQNFNADKVIPPNEENLREYTCANVEERNQYVRDVNKYESCSNTPRYKARAWCECDGIQPACNLLCDDGNPPPDLTKAEPVFGETCLRYVFEFTELTAEKCSEPTKAMNFDAKAFCCNEEPPVNCDICPDGQMVGSFDKVVQTEFFGDVTCGDIVEHAKYLPGGQCKRFMNELLDMPFGAYEECCVPSAAFRRFGSIVLSAGIVFSVLDALIF